MAFLQNLFGGGEISKLEDAVQSASSLPAQFLRLAELYRQHGDEDKARDIIEAGCKRHPEAAELTTLLQAIHHEKNEAERKNLLQRIDQYPSDVLYTRLAELYIKDGEFDAALELTNRGLKMFKDSGSLIMTLGRIEALQGQTDAALHHCQLAIEVDGFNYHAMVLLAELYALKGLHGEAQDTLRKLLEAKPNDLRVGNWLKEYDDRLREITAKYPLHGRAVASEADKVQSLSEDTVKVVIDEATPAPQPAATPRSGDDGKRSSGFGTSLAMEIQEIRRVQGVEGTLLMDPQGLVIASDLPEGLDEDLAAALITNICNSIGGFSNDMNLGEFKDGICDSAQGSIHLHKLDQMTMAVFASRDTKVGLLQRAIHIFSERALNLRG